ncbi:RagB/SusD family nutrient uptake outer membrane protein [Flavihumibacter stibioxidans]|uniref:Carbohydrate-binding protein SusD n=1 Tax=Flavihumibacter stibioxidans TaxID=1834163 RepID=A0ABR7M9E4_9BACT|nr:RagB/SusD family nutrient uptake outer membrane protein [Flavihumibacter stibioxidans]MBC6491652.1 carbohydrate-binding protein SusD [Flavihumibacter stibioxidans]
MRRILYILLAVTGLTACEKKLDLSPTQSISQENALLTEGDVKVTLIGAYGGLQAEALYGGDIQVMNELIGNSENIRFTGTFAGLADIHALEITTQNSFARDTWQGAYNTINRVNNVLSALDKVTTSADERNRIEGEALFIRGSLYFELVKLFAKTWGDGDNATNPGVPLILTRTEGVTPESYAPRSSVAQVYEQIKADLTRAESLLPASNGIYAASGAAAAMLSRVALMQGDYTAARDAANRVIESGEYELTGSFGDLWFTMIDNAGANPSEYVFSMTVTQQDGSNSMNTYFGASTGQAGTGGRGDCKILPAHIDKYEANDARGDYFQALGANFFTKKHLDLKGNVLVVRLAEMYLTRAEANLRLGTSVGATPLADVNIIRDRSNLPGLGTVALADILKERNLELAFEGQGLSDAKRTRSAWSGTAWNSKFLILPIPQREMDVNDKLVQNEAYL